MAGGGPLAGILAGSDSERPVMEKPAARLDEFYVGCEIETRPAQETPESVAAQVPALSDEDLSKKLEG